MKKTLMILSLVFVLLMASFASATLTISDITLGNKNIQRYNPLGDNDNDQVGDTFSTSVTVTNNDTAVSSPALVFSGSVATDFNLSYTLPSTWVNGTNTFTIRGQIPEDWNSNNEDDSEESILAGTFTATGTGQTSASKNVYAWAQAGLTMDSIIVTIDGVDYDYDDDEVTTIVPGSDVSLSFELTNEFGKDSNIEINDVDITVDSDNGDFEVDNDNDNIDLKEDSTKTFSTDISIDWGDVEDGDDTTITIEVVGEDDNGATHSISLDFNMEVNYPDKDISLNDISMSPSAVCAGDKVTFSYEVENIGNDDQNNVRGRIESTTLGLQKNFDTVSIDGRDAEDTESESFSYQYTVPNGTKVGDYTVKVYAYYESDSSKSAYKLETKNLTVLSCAANTGSNTGVITGTTPAATTNTTAGTSGMVIGTNPASGVSGTNGNLVSGATAVGNQVVTATSKPKADDSVYIVGLGILAVLLLIVIIALIAVLRR